MKLIRYMLLVSMLVFTLQAREQVNVNFSNLAIGDFIKLIAKITHENILVNYRINGTVNLVSSSPVYKDELVGILVAVLNSKGFTLTQNGSYYEVIRSNDAAKFNPKVLKPGYRASGTLMVTQAMKIRHENVDIIAAKVRYLLSRTAKLITMKESNTLLITDFPKNIQTIKKVIADIETNNTMIVRIIGIKHAEARKLQSRLSNIAKSIFNAKIASERVKVILDDNTNSIIVVGNRKNIKKIKTLVAKLDVESSVDKSVKIFALKNSDAKSVLNTLNAIISKQKFSDPSLKPSVSMNEELNAIIIVGEPNIVKGIKYIIDELDKEKYQVYVQARIININKSNAENVGLKYGFAAGDISSSGLYAMSANFGSSDLSNAANAAVTSALGTIGTVSKSVLALGATLDFLQTKGASSTISSPSILCINNKESSIHVGKTISIATGSVSNGASGANLTNSFKREDIGLTLTIKPRVSSKDKVTLDIKASLDSLLDDGSNNNTGQPITSKQEVKTQAILRNGESIIIGGLVKEDKKQSKTKVPFLGDIPVIGDALFSSKATSKSQDSLIVLLTPYVINNSEKLSKLQMQLGELVNIQRIYNKAVFQKIEKKKTLDKETETKSESVKSNSTVHDIFHAKKRF